MHAYRSADRIQPSQTKTHSSQGLSVWHRRDPRVKCYARNSQNSEIAYKLSSTVYYWSRKREISTYRSQRGIGALANGSWLRCKRIVDAMGHKRAHRVPAKTFLFPELECFCLGKASPYSAIGCYFLHTEGETMKLLERRASVHSAVSRAPGPRSTRPAVAPVT